VSVTPAAELARLKARYPGWSIRKLSDDPPSYAAVRRPAYYRSGDPITLEATSTAELTTKLLQATSRFPQRAPLNPGGSNGSR
jgi:hypothetical protein